MSVERKVSCMIKKYYCSVIGVVFIFNHFFSISQPVLHSGSEPIESVANTKAEQWMKRPFGFQENRGQMMGGDNKPASYVLFEAQAPNLNIWITTSGLTYQFFTIQKDNPGKDSKVDPAQAANERALSWNRVDMVLKDASIKKENVFTEGDISVGEENYYTAENPDGIFNVKTYSKIVVKDVYLGIDWILYTSAGNMKYDFIVHPNADPNQIRLIYEGSGDFHMENNRIRFSNELGELTEGELICYQGDESNVVQSHYGIKESTSPLYAGAGKLAVASAIIPSYLYKSPHNIFSYEVSINIHDYDKMQPLVIDPQLVWATFFGGSSGISYINSMDDDLAGNIFATGYVVDNPFPVFNPGGGAYFQVVPLSGTTAFVLKFSNSGVRLWATYYTGNTNEVGLGICTDPFGNIFVTGWTSSTVFPLFNPGGGAYYQATRGGVFGAWDIYDAFILKFSNTGVRLWASYYGGGLGDCGKSICSDNLGNIFVTGYTRSNADFPRQNPGGGTYFQALHGGSVSSATDAGDVFVLKFNNSGVRQWATFYGGTDDEVGNGICSDFSGNIFVVGNTKSTDFPLRNFGAPSYYQSALSNPFSFNPPGDDAFIIKFNNSGSLQSATYYGGNSTDIGHSVAADSFGNIFVTGNTVSTDFPVLNPGGGAYYQPVKNGTYDAFILKFTNTGVRLWATHIGGSGSFEALYGSDNINIDPCNNVYMGFETPAAGLLTFSSCGSDYLDNSYNNTTVNAGWTDVYIIKFKNSGVPLWATYFGGDGEDWGAAMTTDQSGNFFVGGNWGNVTNDLTYPLTNPGGGAYYSGFVGSDDCYIAKFIPTPLTISTTFLNSTSGCACNGSASVTVSCSTNGFNYSWSNGSQTVGSTNNTNAISALCPGIYTVSVNDGCAPVVTRSVTITGTSGGIGASITQSNLICNGAGSGTAAIIASGGFGPYTFLWSNLQTTSSITGLAAASYTCTITDAVGCSITRVVSVTQPPAVSVTVSQIRSCVPAVGTATAFPTGISPYSYLWSNGQIGATATGLNSGATYTVTVTDAIGCTVSGTIVSAIIPMVIISTSKNNSCTSTGSASVRVSDGTLPYAYSWSNGQTWSFIDGLTAGGYTVTVTDGNGCTQTKSFNITGVNPVSATFTQSPGGVVCVGTTVAFNNSGSTGIYTWTIGPPLNVTGTTANFSYTFLNVGTYSITHVVTNAGCTATVKQNIIVSDCAGPAVSATGSSVCQGACAVVTSGVTGGASPYTYSWSTGATTQNISPCPVATTTYTVKVTDSGGVTSTSTAVVTISPSILATAVPTNITCNGSANGSAIATGGGGTSPYVYNWSNGQVVQTTTGLTAGNYTVTISDSKGCSAVSTATIISPPAVSGQFAKGTASCIGCGCKEWVIINAIGGTAPYNYTWPDGYVSRYKNQLCPGTYTVNIKDKNGCSVNVNLSTP